MPSSTDCPAPKRSLKARSARASLTAITGTASAPSASSARRRSRPVVVSSVPPSIPGQQIGPRGVQRAQQVGAVVERDPRRALDDGGDTLGPVVRPAGVDLGLRRQRRGDVVLGRERVRRRQRDVGASGLQRPDQHGGLGGDVQAGADDDARERLLAGEAFPDRAQDGHLPVRPLDPVETRLSSDSGPACRGPRPARRCRRPARARARSGGRRARRGAGARPSRRGAWAGRRPACRSRRSS